MAHGVLTLKEIYTAISDTDSTKFGARNAGIILFMLSSNLDQKFMAKLTINDLIVACSDYLEDPNLSSLLNLDPWEIAPCWKDIQDNPRMVFSSPESTFYVFLHLKQRLKEGNIDSQEPLFMGDKNRGLKPNSIRDVITAVDDKLFSYSFTPSSLKKTYADACENHFSDINLVELFTKEITSDNPFYSKSSCEIRHYYEELLPLLTSRLFDVSIRNMGIDEVNVDKIVKEYFKTFYKTHEDKYSRFGMCKILNFAQDLAKENYDEGIFRDDVAYLNNIFEQCEMGYLLIESDYYQEFQDNPKKSIPYKFSSDNYDERVNNVIEIFRDLGILDVFKPSDNTLRDELTCYAAHNNMNFYYLTYGELIGIFNNVLIPMAMGKYETKF